MSSRPRRRYDHWTQNPDNARMVKKLNEINIDPSSMMQHDAFALLMDAWAKDFELKDMLDDIFCGHAHNGYINRATRGRSTKGGVII